MKQIQKNFSFAEEKWLNLLFEFSREKFTQTRLPSHDHFHHFRVWNYAKSLILALSDIGISYDPEEIEALIISVFFHDIGMTVTRDKEHGFESSQICRQFFSSQLASAPKNLDIILDMIEKHDDKEYPERDQSSIKPPLHVLLNISDDLDAFGNIGVYRYIEIYHFRGIPVNQMPARILTNLENRFHHFSQELGHLLPIIELHKKRYNITRDFFLKLENELKVQGSDDKYSSRIVQALIEFANGNEMDIHALLKNTRDNQQDTGFVNFFNEFFNEWDGN